MKFKIEVAYRDEKTSWIEDYDKPQIHTLAEAQEWAEYTIKRFNDTLRPYEWARKLIKVEAVEGETDQHDWYKSCLVTQRRGGRLFDTMTCNGCGITAKRYGLSGLVIDSAFKAKAFKTCSGAKALLEKRRAKEAK